MDQAKFGEALNLEQSPQGRISHYETGRQNVPVDVAREFIALAKSMGESISFDDIYSNEAA